MPDTVGPVPITPDEGKKVHEEGAIKQLRQFFKDHTNGIPELIKNADDEYMRREFPEHLRAIGLLLHGGAETSSISVLDVAGMTSETLETKLSVWADPDASRGGDADVQGGKGNGGKAYLAEMFEHGALIVTLRDGMGQRYGLRGGGYVFGFSPDADRGKNIPVADPITFLAAALNKLQMSLEDVPPKVLEAIRETGGFSLVTGIAPKDVGARLPSKEWQRDLESHAQMQISIEHSEIFISHSHSFRQLRVPAIDPMPGTDAVRTIPIPEVLKDPKTGQDVSTTGNARFSAGTLELRSSKVSLRKSGRSLIQFRAPGHGFYGVEPVVSFGPTSTYRDRFYGTCNLAATADMALNDRGVLSDSPLTRAVRAFIGDEIQSWCVELEAKEKRASSQQEQQELSRLNELLSEWSSQFLDPEPDNSGSDDGSRGERKPRNTLPEGIVSRVELLGVPQHIGQGVSVKPHPKFFDKNDVEVRAVPYRWVPGNLEMLDTDDDINVLTSRTPGATTVVLETYDGAVRSDEYPVEVVEVVSIELDPSEVVLHMYKRQFIKSTSVTTDGRTLHDVHLRWESTDESVAITTSMGAISGRSIGTALVSAMDDVAVTTNPVAVTVIEEEETDDDGKGGKRFPRILVSGVNPDPDTGDVFNLSEDDAPVVQRVEDIPRDIWWINTSSPLAKMLLEEHGSKSEVWRLYHVDRYIEAITQVLLRADGSMETEQAGELWLQDIGVKASEVQRRAASSLKKLIAKGESLEQA